jgi:mRNA interferase RelE/StbE
MYSIKYHRLVLEKDFKRLNLAEKRKIASAIAKKLSISPERFGKPLTGDLKGLYRLRVDPWRIIYRIKKTEITVLVLCVGMRKDLKVYLEMAKRIGIV